MKSTDFVPGIFFTIAQKGFLRDYVFKLEKSSINSDCYIEEVGSITSRGFVPNQASYPDRARVLVLNQSSFIVRKWVGGIEVVSPKIQFKSLIPYELS